MKPFEANVRILIDMKYILSYWKNQKHSYELVDHANVFFDDFYHLNDDCKVIIKIKVEI